MLRIALALTVLLSIGCVLESEPKVRRIDCGTLNLEENEDGVMSDTLSVKGGSCQ